MKKILWIGDGVVPTGFSTVNHNIIRHLPKDKYEVHHLAVNYYGDPHEYDHTIYPAALPVQYQQGDLLGYTRIQEFADKGFDAIFILNDIWVIDKYLEYIKEAWKESMDKLPEIVVYYPVDGSGYTPKWFMNFDIVSRVVVYTEFGKEVTLEAMPSLDVTIIPHGAVDKANFYPVENAKQTTFKTREDLWTDDSFIVLNANRNQPRKRLDISLLGFAMFAKDKPKDVMYYHHAGLKDAGWDIVDVIQRIERELDMNLQERIILTNAEYMTQRIPMSQLNEIYNSCDVGINTSLGEGWGLTNTEHAALGKPQIVGNHSASAELFEDCGLLIPVSTVVRDEMHSVKRFFVNANGLAHKLEMLYGNKELYKDLSNKSKEKFNSPTYDWEEIAKKWVELFDELWS